MTVKILINGHNYFLINRVWTVINAINIPNGIPHAGRFFEDPRRIRGKKFSSFVEARELSSLFVLSYLSINSYIGTRCPIARREAGGVVHLERYLKLSSIN